MWSPVDIFVVCFLLNFSPNKDARLSVKETPRNNGNKSLEKIDKQVFVAYNKHNWKP
jgi:hypothetical protein